MPLGITLPNSLTSSERLDLIGCRIMFSRESARMVGSMDALLNQDLPGVLSKAELEREIRDAQKSREQERKRKHERRNEKS